MKSNLERSAIFSADNKYRYKLTRFWGDDDGLTFIMLNPSTANSHKDDPTIRKCMNIAYKNGYSGISVLNLFALVSSNPNILLTEKDSVGKENDWWLNKESEFAKKIIVAWGNFGLRFPQRVGEVLEILKRRDLYCLGKNKSGQPKHPLYTPSIQTLDNLFYASSFRD